MSKILDNVNTPEDLKKLNINEIYSLISNVKIDIGFIFLLTEKQYTFLQLVKGKEKTCK